MKYFEVIFTISAPAVHLQDVRDVLAALAAEAGLETFEDTPDGMKGYVQRSLFNETMLKEAIAALPFPEARVDFKVDEVADEDWNEQWEQAGFDPIVVDQHLIIHDGRHLPHPTLIEDRLMVEIDTRLAFGTGNHATTRMMARGLMTLPLNECTVLDCGTGTGVLAIVALLRGARDAIGFDIDEWSIDNARHNAFINHVDERFTSILGDSIVVKLLNRRFDIVLANINRNILLADMPRMREAMNDRATLLISGFYTSDSPVLKAKAGELGLKLKEEYSEDDWACLIFTC